MKKVVVWLMVAMMAVSVCGCGFSDGVKDGMEAAANKETETEGATEEQTEAEETEVKEPESVPETEAESEEETPGVSVGPEKAETAQVESINVLMTAPVTEHEEKNDTKWAEVVVDKELLKATTNEEFAEFCNKVVKDSGYNWVTASSSRVLFHTWLRMERLTRTVVSRKLPARLFSRRTVLTNILRMSNPCGTGCCLHL